MYELGNFNACNTKRLPQPYTPLVYREIAEKILRQERIKILARSVLTSIQNDDLTPFLFIVG